jgi:hypothetical protein
MKNKRKSIVMTENNGNNEKAICEKKTVINQPKMIINININNINMKNNNINM